MQPGVTVSLLQGFLKILEILTICEAVTWHENWNEMINSYVHILSLPQGGT